MGFADRVIARAAPERRAIAEWGTSAIPGPLGAAVGHGSFSSIDLRKAEASLQKVAIWSAADLIASLAAQLPLDTYRKASDGTGVAIANPKLVDDPGGDGNGAQDWIYQYLMSKLLRGNAYGRGASPDPRTGQPTQIVLYHPDDVRGSRDAVSGDVTWRVSGREVDASQIWHRRSYPMPGQLLGMSPVALHITTIAQGLAAARFGLQWFTDGAHPSSLLTNSEAQIDPKIAAEVKARYMAAIHGTREPLVMGKGWDHKAISVSPEESQFLATQKYTAAECARIFGPCIAEILGYETGGSMTYTNVEQRGIDLLKFVMNRWLRDVESVFTRLLPQPQYVRFNRAALLETDLISRYNAHRTAREIGLSNIDELRVLEDMGPLPDGKGQDYTPLLVQVAASRGIDAAQVGKGEPPSDQPNAGRRSAEPNPKDGEPRTFDPAKHPHGVHGHWASVGLHADPKHDKLKLGGRIHLGPDEKLTGSAKVDGDIGGIRMALTETHGVKSLRLGVGGEEYGKPNRDEGIAAWDGNPSHQPLPEADRKRLEAELEALDQEFDAADPARQKKIDDRMADIQERLTSADAGFNGTAKLDEHGMGQLADRIRPALAEAAAREKAENAAWDEIEALQAKGNPDPARIAELQKIVDRTGQITFTKGVVPGSEWGDVHFSVELDDISQGPELHLGVQPKDAPADWGDGKDWMGQFDTDEARKILRLLTQYAQANARAARGADTTPGDDELHHYWTVSAGRAKWVESSEPWTTLVALLTPHVGPVKAKMYASRWFIEVFGFAAGSDLNRVTHGHPPRGKKIGPG